MVDLMVVHSILVARSVYMPNHVGYSVLFFVVENQIPMVLYLNRKMEKKQINNYIRIPISSFCVFVVVLVFGVAKIKFN